MTKEVNQFIAQHKKVLIKINKAALNDINKELLVLHERWFSPRYSHV